jgi:hypothetical protein
LQRWILGFELEGETGAEGKKENIDRYLGHQF